MTLTEPELTALAALIAARQLETAEWFGWEDYPELDENDFERLVAAVQTRGRALRSFLTGYEIDHDVDAHDVERRAAPTPA